MTMTTVKYDGAVQCREKRTEGKEGKDSGWEERGGREKEMKT